MIQNEERQNKSQGKMTQYARLVRSESIWAMIKLTRTNNDIIKLWKQWLLSRLNFGRQKEVILWAPKKLCFGRQKEIILFGAKSLLTKCLRDTTWRSLISGLPFSTWESPWGGSTSSPCRISPNAGPGPRSSRNCREVYCSSWTEAKMNKLGTIESKRFSMVETRWVV